MITVQQGIAVLEPRIETKSRHAHYQRTINRRDLYLAMMTGDKIDTYLTRFKSREDEEQFKVRQYITQECVSPAIGEAVSEFYKTSRYPNINQKITYEKQDDIRLPRLMEQLRLFSHDGDVQKYLAEELDRPSLIDPNAFLVLDFNSFDPLQNQRPDVYGVLVPCDNICDFHHLPNGELNYLIIERPGQFYNDSSDIIDYLDYIAYLGDDILVYEQVVEYRIQSTRGELITLGAEQYIRYTLSSKAGQVQAIRVGYLKDPLTDYLTCISPLNPAETVVMDLINDKSNYDQTKLFHCFPQKFAFVERCPGVMDQSGYPISSCKGGRDIEGKVCERCSGSGVLMHQSAADTITLPLPRDKDEFIMRLDEMVHYAKPDIEIIRHLREDVDAGKSAVVRAIFATDSMVQTTGPMGPNVVKTATEYDLKNDDKNNILLPFCEHKTRMYKFIVRQIALFNDLADNLIVLFEYPASLRLETLEELQLKFSQLVAAGASASLLDDIEKEIAAKRFQDDPKGLKKYQTYRMHRPFRNRTKEEVEFAIGNGSVPKHVEVLWANFELIMTDLDNEVPGFFEMNYKEQKTLIRAKSDELVGELPKEMPERVGVEG